MDMGTVITFKAVYIYYGECEVKGIENYQDKNGVWIEHSGKQEVSVKQQLQEIIEAGAKMISLKLDVKGVIEYGYFEPKELIKTEYSELQNRRMAEKLLKGDAVDLRDCDKTTKGYYILDDFIEEKDYCDSKDESWIWSIGISYKSGQILASKSNVFYQNLDFECLFLR